jgi:hypothetical protein
VHKRDSHVHRLMIALRGLLLAPQAWYFRIEELTCVVVYHYDFYRPDPVCVDLVGDVIIFARCPKQLMMWCPKILTLDDDSRDDGVWQVAYDPGFVP